MIKKALLVFVFIIMLTGSAIAAPVAAYIRGASSPWGSTSNEALMTTVFGAVGTGWNDLRMSGGVGPFLPGSGYYFIFLEGSDFSANELNAYLTANRTDIENFVANGGTLLLNSAPNQGANINFGFGGMTLVYPSFSSSVTAADSAQPDFLGPYGTSGTTFTGPYFAHAIVTGPGMTPILYTTGTSNVVLGEKTWGTGLVLLGGMTTPNWHSPQPQAGRFHLNVVSNAIFADTVDTDGDGLPDWWERLYGTDPLNPADPVLTQDVDGDGLNWLQEYQNRTNPLIADTNGDGITDGAAVAAGLNPLIFYGTNFTQVTPGSYFGSIYFQFIAANLDPSATGFRVYYGSHTGTVAGDYEANFDINNVAARDALIDQTWGMQGVPYIYFRIAPILAGGAIGPLSDEATMYFSAANVTTTQSNGGTTVGPNAGVATATETTTKDKFGVKCFIATAAYGSPYEQHVALLRKFRDAYLLTNAPGRWFVETYYRTSPPIAAFVSEHEWAKFAVRGALAPAVGLSYLLVEASPAARISALLVFMGLTISLFAIMKRRKTRA